MTKHIEKCGNDRVSPVFGEMAYGLMRVKKNFNITMDNVMKTIDYMVKNKKC